MTIGQELKAARAAKGLTQEKLAAEAGVSLNTLARAEQDRHVPSLVTFALIARALGVTVDSLIPEAESVA